MTARIGAFSYPCNALLSPSLVYWVSCPRLDTFIPRGFVSVNKSRDIFPGQRCTVTSSYLCVYKSFSELYCQNEIDGQEKVGLCMRWQKVGPV